MRGTFVRLKNKKVIGKIKEFSEFFFFIEKTKLCTSLFMSISYYICIFFDIFIHLVICIMIFFFN